MSNKRVIICDACGKMLVGLAKIKEHMRVSYECKTKSINVDLQRIADPKAIVRVYSASNEYVKSKYTKKDRQIIDDISDKIMSLTSEQAHEYIGRV